MSAFSDIAMHSEDSGVLVEFQTLVPDQERTVSVYDYHECMNIFSQCTHLSSLQASPPERSGYLKSKHMQRRDLEPLTHLKPCHRRLDPP